MQATTVTWNTQVNSSHSKVKEHNMAKQIKKAAKSMGRIFAVRRENRIYNELD